jgi:hypothetical protein
MRERRRCIRDELTRFRVDHSSQAALTQCEEIADNLRYSLYVLVGSLDFNCLPPPQFFPYRLEELVIETELQK